LLARPIAVWCRSGQGGFLAGSRAALRLHIYSIFCHCKACGFVPAKIVHPTGLRSRMRSNTKTGRKGSALRYNRKPRIVAVLNVWVIACRIRTVVPVIRGRELLPGLDIGRRRIRGIHRVGIVAWIRADVRIRPRTRIRPFTHVYAQSGAIPAAVRSATMPPVRLTATLPLGTVSACMFASSVSATSMESTGAPGPASAAVVSARTSTCKRDITRNRDRQNRNKGQRELFHGSRFRFQCSASLQFQVSMLGVVT